MRWRAGLLAALVLMLLPACGNTDRPEGVVERWLVSLNQGAAGRPQQYAPERLSQQILPHWATRDPGQLDVIEVGKGRLDDRQSVSARPITYFVPYRVKRLNGPTLSGVAVLTKTSDGWLVANLWPPQPGLSVPTAGGERIGNASLALWLASLGVAFVFVVVSWALMSTFGRTRGAIA